MTGTTLDQTFPSLDQKGGEGATPTSRVMRTQGRTPLPTRHRSASRLAVVATVLLVGAVVFLPAYGAGASPTDWTSYSMSWTNGVVLCVFDPTTPAVTVSSPTLNGTGLWAAVGAIQEVGPGGTVATATLAEGSWIATNLSTDDFFELAYSGHVPILPTGVSAPTGSVDLQIDFILPAYTGSGPTNEVDLTVHLSNWSWQAPHDSMDLILPLASAFPPAERLVVGGPPGALMTGVSNQSGQPLEYLSTTQLASASAPGIATTNLSVYPSLTVLPASASVTVAFGTEAGAFHSLNYTTAIGVALPSTIAGFPIIDFVLVASAAVVASLGIAAGVRVVRRRPSDLEYVEEEA